MNKKHFGIYSGYDKDFIARIMVMAMRESLRFPDKINLDDFLREIRNDFFLDSDDFRGCYQRAYAWVRGEVYNPFRAIRDLV